MPENNSLLNQESLLSKDQLETLVNENSFDELIDNNTTSLLNNPQETDTSSPNNEIEAEVARQKLIEEHNQRVLKSPEYQARIIFEQHIANAISQGIYYTGPQRKSIYKQMLRKAQKGRYNYLFDEGAQQRKAEKMRKKFDKLNKPQVVHSADELSEETKARLQEMVNEEPWNDIKPKID